MFGTLLLIYLSARNGNRARRKGLKPILWAGVTVLSFFATMVIGVYVVIFGFCADKVNVAQMSSPDAKVRAAVTAQLAQIFENDPLHMITVLLFGLGGYLFVRYLLENRPDKKEPKAEAEVSGEPLQ
jgi:hypothetical protein